LCLESKKAKEEVQRLLQDVVSAGLQSAVRIGPDSSLLIILKAPPNLLGNAIHRSRIKDWLYGITTNRPRGSYDAVVQGKTEAETLRSIYHLVTWQKTLGGAGITPGHGQWKNVKSAFPIHNRVANRSLLSKFSRKVVLNREDLDDIRAIYGEQVAYYFCFIQSYIIALIFPSLMGVFAWAFLHRVSSLYAVLTTTWCIVFLEYWRMQEISLSIRWDVQGVGSLKVNRQEYFYEKEVRDKITGEVQQYFPKYKQVLRQLISLPFGLAALLVLGTITTGVFAIEIFISHIYTGQYKDYLEYVPTVILALCLPFVSDFLETVAQSLTEYENWRTQDRYDMSLTQKVFLLNFITKYLPIFLTAFVYIPFGDEIMIWAQQALGTRSTWSKLLGSDIHVDTSRLRSEIIALTVTEQIWGFGEELFVPMLKLRVHKWYGNWKNKNRSFNYSTTEGAYDTPKENELLSQIRDQAMREKYSAHEDIQEMCIQFGYLALFSPIWPLVPVMFLINNWVELRSDLLKIAIDHRRPDPVRTDSIGSWIDSMHFLTWLGSIVTAAIVHLFHDTSRLNDSRTWWTLPITIFVTEHIYLAVKYLVRFALEQLGSAETRQKHLHEYVNRKENFKQYMCDDSSEAIGMHTNVGSIKSEAQKAAQKPIERLRDIDAMIDFIKDDGKCVPSTRTKEA
jgi:anoctamin-10